MPAPRKPLGSERHHEKWIAALALRDIQSSVQNPVGWRTVFQPVTVQKMAFQVGLGALKQAGLKSPENVEKLWQGAVLFAKYAKRGDEETRKEAARKFGSISTGRQFVAAFSVKMKAAVTELKEKRTRMIQGN